MTIFLSDVANIKKRSAKKHKLVKVEVVIDQTAEGSLALVQRLQEIGSVSHRGDGIYLVKRVTEKAVLDVTEQFPQAVMKVEKL